MVVSRAPGITWLISSPRISLVNLNWMGIGLMRVFQPKRTLRTWQPALLGHLNILFYTQVRPWDNNGDGVPLNDHMFCLYQKSTWDNNGDGVPLDYTDKLNWHAFSSSKPARTLKCRHQSWNGRYTHAYILYIRLQAASTMVVLCALTRGASSMPGRPYHQLADPHPRSHMGWWWESEGGKICGEKWL
jgi:hypothetical protein